MPPIPGPELAPPPLLAVVLFENVRDNDENAEEPEPETDMEDGEVDRESLLSCNTSSSSLECFIKLPSNETGSERAFIARAMSRTRDPCRQCSGYT